MGENLVDCITSRLRMTLSMYCQLLYMWIGLALIVLPVAIIKVAPYGRHTREGWGWMMDNKWGWIIMELPTLIILPVFSILYPSSLSLPISVMIVCYLLHYIHRVMIYPNFIKTEGKRIPLNIVLSAFFFNVINGLVLSYFFFFIATYEDAWLMDPRFIIGLVIFLIGAYINVRSDYFLISLRKPGETGYKIPKGFMFQYVSCPNHLGEIIEWLGFGIMAWAFPVFSFSIWTASNLIPRTLNHHSWYLKLFPDYPKERKAVIPFVL